MDLAPQDRRKILLSILQLLIIDPNPDQKQGGQQGSMNVRQFGSMETRAPALTVIEPSQSSKFLFLLLV